VGNGLTKTGNKKGKIVVSLYETTQDGSPYTRWKVDVPASIAKKRMRLFFISREEAEGAADKFRKQIAQRGWAGIEEDAMHFLSVTDAISRFWSRRENIKCFHRRNFEGYLSKFQSAFGPAPLKSITPFDLEDFWNRPAWGATTRNQAFRYLRMFFNWCERYDFIERNPTSRVEAPVADDAPKLILTPEQMSAALTAATPPLRAFLALGGFAGLRTTEAIALPLAGVESDIIRVVKGKTGGRFINRLPAFDAAWPGIEVTPKTARAFYMALNGLAVKLGWAVWPKNCLRHSFGSYHLAMWEDAPRTAFQMGHRSPQMLYRAYARAVRKEDAVRWSAIGSPAD